MSINLMLWENIRPGNQLNQQMLAPNKSFSLFSVEMKLGFGLGTFEVENTLVMNKSV